MKIERYTPESPRKIRFLLYGESGTGKTVHAASWPKPVFLDADHGMISIRREVDRINLSSWEEVVEVLQFLASGEHEYATVVVDTLNEIQRLLMEFIVRNFPTKRSYDTQPTLPDYGKMIDDTLEFVRFIGALPMHSIFIAQVRDREFETDLVQPLLVGKRTSKEVAKRVDLVGYMYRVEDGKRIIAFDIPQFVTKDRTGLLPAAVEVGENGFQDLNKYLQLS